MPTFRVNVQRLMTYSRLVEAETEQAAITAAVEETAEAVADEVEVLSASAMEADQ